MSATVKDVAKLAGVSTSTVSRVINDDPRISTTTKEKVLTCIEELDYRINTIARSLKTSKTHSIGFVCPELTNNFFMSVAKGIEDELRKHNYSMIICNSNENIDEEKHRLDLLLEKCVDGIIIIPSSFEGQHLNYIKDQKIPVVLVDRLVDNFESDAVLVDNINGAYAATEKIISKGYRRIGFIGGDMRLSSAHERYEGYNRALFDYSIPLETEIVKFGDFHINSGYEMMKQLLEQESPPEYVFISNYFMHVGATKFLMESDKSSGKTVNIASFDDMEFTSMLNYCKLIVDQPIMEIGQKAAELLLQRISGDNPNFPSILRLKTKLKQK